VKKDAIPAKNKNWVTGCQKDVQSEAEYVGNMRMQIRYKNLDILRAAASITEHYMFTQEHVRLKGG
jgi:hypothetical protein